MSPISQINQCYGTKGVQLLSDSIRNGNPSVSLQNLYPSLVHKVSPYCKQYIVLKG